jgi:hypothetical protein
MSIQTGDKVRVTVAAFDGLPVGTEGTVKLSIQDGTKLFVDTPTHPDILGLGWPLRDTEVEAVEA